MLKSKLRNQVKKRLQSIDKDTYESYCERINKRLFKHAFWKQSETIALTISRGREIETSMIIEEAWRQNKKVVIPKCYPDQFKMEFRTFESESQLEIVYFGLKEPIVSKTSLIKAQDIDLVIVPGICFDREGFRIGYGGGYYDRYLSEYKGQTISLAFETQIVPSIPVEPYDMPVHQILTEKEVIVPGG